jgi:hypothetical protein
MSHTFVSYSVKPGREQEDVALIRGVFEELATAQSAGMRYAVFQSADSREFAHLYTDESAAPDALQALSAFEAFVDGAADRHEHAAMFKEFESPCIPSTATLTPYRPPSCTSGASAGSSNTSKQFMLVEHDGRGLPVDPSASVAPAQIACCP